MKCRELKTLLESNFPVKYALQGDNTGFLIGDLEAEVHHVYVAVDATEEVIQDAIDAGADFLLTHHPMIFRPMSKITSEDFQGRKVIKLIQNKIAYMVTHTNYDSCRMAELAAKRMGLKDCQVLEEVADGKGIGCTGMLPEKMSLRACGQLVKQQFQIPSVRYFGSGEQMVERVSICPGSGRSTIGACHEQKAQVLITGDIDHHTGIDQADDQLPIIDAGHYGIEHIYIEDICEMLKKQCLDLQVTGAKIKHPFETL